MIAFADTNWLVAAYFVNSRTPVVQRFAARNDLPWQVCAPVLLECHAVFPRLARLSDPPQLGQLRADLGGKLVLHPFTWDDLARHAESLLSQYAHKAQISVIDAMVIAAAKAAGAGWLLCFDTGSNTRALAAAVRLHVFPDLTEEDEKRLATLK